MSGGPLQQTLEPDALVNKMPEPALRDEGPGGTSPWVHRRSPEVLVTVGLVVLALLQHPGRIVRDTKLDLAFDPGRFLASATHLWNAQAAFGSVPDQAFGYLFPMGPYYWLGAVLHVPVWILQRTWLALLLSAAFWGALKMAEAFKVGTPATRLAGGVAYALSPLIVAQVHDTSYVLPAVLLPWVMLPLKRHVDGAITARTAAARSGLAVLCMGGINASVTFAPLLLPVIWFVVQPRSRRLFKLFAAWCIATFLATAWFVIPLVFQGRFGLNFLPYTETASPTTGSTFLPEILRGAGVWTSLSSGPPLWSPAGHLIETSAVVIVASAVVAGIGLYGLASRRMPDRFFFGIAVIVGVLIVCAGYNGHLGSPFASEYQSALNGSLALFRNVYKFQPVIALPLCLGLIHAAAQWVAALREWSVRWKRSVIAVLAVGLVAAIGLAAAPIFVARIYPDGSFSKLPSYYYQASGWLNARGATSTTLVLPGSEFTRTTWGNPLDNPLQVLSTVPWANRNSWPQGSIGNTEFLDAVDQVLANGQPATGFAPFLARAGVRYILVQNDLSPAYASQPTPALVRLVLSEEPGVQRVAQFGPLVRQTNSGFVADTIFDPNGATKRIRSLEIYRIETPSSTTPSVTTYPADAGVALSGGPQGLLTLANTGRLGEEAVTLAGDPLGPSFRRTTWVDTDAQQLRDTTFTSLYNNQSEVLTPEQGRQSGPLPNQYIVVPGVRHETVSRLSNGVSISASSSGPTFSRIPSDQPLSAFLSDSGGASWIAKPEDGIPWIEIRFARDLPIDKITVTPLLSSQNSIVSAIRISTMAGSVTRRIARTERPQTFAVPESNTRFLRISLLDDHQVKDGATLSAGLRHVAIPGVSVTQTLVMPSDGPTHGTTAPEFLLTSPIPDQFEYLRSPDDETQLDRTFTVPAPGGPYLIGGQVTPLHVPALPSNALSAPFSLACGSGPTITLDGTAYPTSVQGEVGDLYAQRPMSLTLCTPGAAVDLSPGSHTLTGSDPSAMFKVTQLAVAGSLLPPTTQKPPRSISMSPSSDDARQLTVSPGPAAILDVKQNYNPGWVATIGHRTLHAVRLDGWQQGYMLPASASEQQVDLRFIPDETFRILLLFGGVLAMVLALLAVFPARRREVLADGADATEFRDVRSRSRARHSAPGAHAPAILWGTLVIAVAVFFVGGPVLAAVALLLGVLCVLSGRAWLGWLALGAETAAGVIIAYEPGYRTGELLGSGSYTAQALGAVAFIALALSLLPVRRGREEERGL